MSARERRAGAVLKVGVAVTLLCVLTGRRPAEQLAAAVLTVAAALWVLAVTVAETSRRHAAAVRSLRQIHLYAHNADSARTVAQRRNPSPAGDGGVVRLPRRPR